MIINKTSADKSFSMLLKNFGTSLGIIEELSNIFNLLLSDFWLSFCVGQNPCWCYQLNAISEGGIWSDFAQMSEGFRWKLDTFCWGSDGENLHQLFKSVVGCLDDQQSVKKIDWDAVGGNQVGSSDSTHSSVCGKNDDWCQCGFQSSV